MHSAAVNDVEVDDDDSAEDAELWQHGVRSPFAPVGMTSRVMFASCAAMAVANCCSRSWYGPGGTGGIGGVDPRGKTEVAACKVPWEVCASDEYV